MKIEVATKVDDNKTIKGDLLESLAVKFLTSQNYEVIDKINFTGVELDLLCRFKPNNKQVYVECKAYGIDNHIQSSVIKALIGTKHHEGYEEAWLITTTELGKDAKGLVEEISNREDSKEYVFYTPDKLIKALVGASIIKSEEVLKEVFLDTVKDVNKLGESIFLVTRYGDFWVKSYLDGGEPIGIIFAFANNGVIVRDKKLLNNLSNLKTSFSQLDFNIIFTLTEKDSEAIPQKICIENLKLNPIYLDKINDLGVKISHPDKGILFLEDVFIYPDLEEIEDEEDAKFISSKKLLDLDAIHNKYFIFGEDISGKTSLALTLQRNLDSNDYVVLFLSGEEIKNHDDNKFKNLLIKKFEEQYHNHKSYVEAFNNILIKDKQKVILIIDNYEFLGIKKSEAQINFFKMISQQFTHLFIFANKSLEIEVRTKSELKEIMVDFEVLRLKELGHVLRDELISKWLMLQNEESMSDLDFFEKKDSISEKIKIAIGTNFIPTYPLYILTMLQFIDDASKLKLQGSSYAELYGFLITQALGSVNARIEDLDFFHTYLSYIGYHFLKYRKKGLTREDIFKIYSDYSKEMDIDKKFDTVHELLIKAKLLKMDDGLYRFNHNYSYYFFVAKYLAENIEKKEVIERIKIITTKLYTNEFANIIIFLIHHSKNQNIIRGILSESERIFNGIKPYTLSNVETSKINNLIQEEIKFYLKDGKPKEYRRKKLEEKDRAESRKINNKNYIEEDLEKERKLDLFENLNLSFKLIEIQGQIANNYYGSLKAIQKAKILKSTYLLGFRGLRMLLEDFIKFEPILRDNIKKELAKRKIFSQGDIDKIVDKFVFAFTGGIVNLFVKKISDSIASKNLLISIEKIEDKNNDPATRLVGVAVKLNFPDGLNKDKILILDREFKDNYLAKTLLRLLVVEHLYKFEVKYSLKQSICDNLGISFLQNRKILDKRRKKI